VAIGLGLDRAFFGGGGGSGSEAPEPQTFAEGGAVPESGMPSFAGESPIPDTVCSRFVMDFKKCMEQSGHDVAACKWPMNLLESCQAEQAGLAEAARF
jgi:hypothetical protein